MNYFELFEIPVQLKVDKSALSSTFFRLSKKYHPDYFVNAAEDIQKDALEKSALLNKAWKTFLDPDETIKYVLQLKEMLQEEEKYELPPLFLMEVMEINEQLMDIEHASTHRLQSRLNELELEIYEPVKDIIESYQEGITNQQDLLLVKDYYYKKKYLDRISRQLAGMP